MVREVLKADIARCAKVVRDAKIKSDLGTWPRPVKTSSGGREFPSGLRFRQIGRVGLQRPGEPELAIARRGLPCWIIPAANV